MNAIAAYVVPILVKIYILQGWQYKLNGVTASLQDTAIAWCVTHAGRIPGGWMYTLGYILFWWIILFWMYRKKVFLKI
jgi:predicted acyltransferase